MKNPHGTCADCNEEMELVAFDKHTGEGVCWQCTDAPNLVPSAKYFEEQASKRLTKKQLAESDARYAMLPDQMFRSDMAVN